MKFQGFWFEESQLRAGFEDGSEEVVFSGDEFDVIEALGLRVEVAQANDGEEIVMVEGDEEFDLVHWLKESDLERLRALEMERFEREVLR